jgi:hypothetical protein
MSILQMDMPFLTFYLHVWTAAGPMEWLGFKYRTLAIGPEMKIAKIFSSRVTRFVCNKVAQNTAQSIFL